jgi:spore germination protein
MKKLIIFLSLLILVVAGIFFIFSQKQTESKLIIKNNSEKETKQQAGQTTTQQEEIVEVAQPLFVSGWLPYWAKTDGASSLEGNLELFDEINPFSFQVTTEGEIVDAVEIEKVPWTELLQSAKTSGTQIVPTLLWTDSEAIHKVLGNEASLKNHLTKIMELLEKYDFPGVDIDYEGKNITDKDLFTNFIQKLEKELQTANKKLSCTIEARTMDSPPADWDGVRAMSYSNDIPTLAKSCDEIRVMAYDEVFQKYGAKQTFRSEDTKPFVPNADTGWVEEVIQYMLKYIPKEKLALGVPTYGWEFQMKELPNGFEYTRYRSISFPDAMGLANSNNITPGRNQGGELDFVYLAEDGSEHIVNFSDAEAIGQKIELAKKYQLKGISIFKIDGLTDPELFPALEKEIGNND